MKGDEDNPRPQTNPYIMLKDNSSSSSSHPSLICYVMSDYQLCHMGMLK